MPALSSSRGPSRQTLACFGEGSRNDAAFSQRIGLSRFGLNSGVAALEALSSGFGVDIGPPRGNNRPHLDTVDGAGRNTELTTGTQRCNDRMHGLGGADDRVDRTGFDAQGATNAVRWIDPSCAARLLQAARLIQRQFCLAGQRSESFDARLTTRRTTINGGLAGNDRLRIRQATVKAAFRALRLRQ
jgi:hypothetical protein